MPFPIGIGRTWNENFVVPDGAILARIARSIGHIYLDRLDVAGMAAQRLLEVSPGITVSDFERMDLWRPATTQSFAEALCKAGLPQ